MTKITDKKLIVTMPNGEKYSVPVSIIATHRATYYAKEFDTPTPTIDSLEQDTIPLFEADWHAIKDWAENNMNWSDVAQWAEQIKRAPRPDYQDGWVNGPKEIR